jgi:predicted nucleotidyltransferase
MTAVRIPSELEPYLEQLVDTLRRSAPIEAVYLLGSAAQAAYEHGRSDVDVVAVRSSRSPRASSSSSSIRAAATAGSST